MFTGFFLKNDLRSAEPTIFEVNKCDKWGTVCKALVRSFFSVCNGGGLKENSRKSLLSLRKYDRLRVFVLFPSNK
jgi:hypothetical protein